MKTCSVSSASSHSAVPKPRNGTWRRATGKSINNSFSRYAFPRMIRLISLCLAVSDLSLPFLICYAWNYASCYISMFPPYCCNITCYGMLFVCAWWRKSFEWTISHFLSLNCFNFGSSLIHSQGNTLFTCYVCDRTFLSSEELTQHQPTHSKDDKPFKCVHCKESFKTFSEVSKPLVTITANINTC